MDVAALDRLREVGEDEPGFVAELMAAFVADMVSSPRLAGFLRDAEACARAGRLAALQQQLETTRAEPDAAELEFRAYLDR